jgi:hypothetical protein
MEIMMTNSRGLGGVKLWRHGRQKHEHEEVQTRDKGGTETWRCMLTNGGSQAAVTGALDWT